MSTQEKINQLAQAALRSAPPLPVRPRPVTYMAPFEKPRIVGLVAAPKPFVPSSVAAAVDSAPAAAFR